jgi:ribosomal protein S18 acetylase RimI-like enzyme
MTTSIRPVGPDEWELVAWLWQAYRSDLAPIVQGLPYADGRYAHGSLDGYPGPFRAGYLARRPHPHTDARAPVGFALAARHDDGRWHMDAFWTAPAARRDGVGLRLASHVVEQHPGPWTIAFQHDNVGAGGFWRRVATQLFGPGGVAWTEELRPVPGRPQVPPDHWIETLP